MALIKSTTLPSGVSGNYWKLASFTARKIGSTAKVEVRLDLFKDSSFSAGKAIPGTAISFTFELTAQDLVGNVPAICYLKIKERNHPSLIGAVDA